MVFLLWTDSGDGESTDSGRRLLFCVFSGLSADSGNPRKGCCGVSNFFTLLCAAQANNPIKIRIVEPFSRCGLGGGEAAADRRENPLPVRQQMNKQHRKQPMLAHEWNVPYSWRDKPHNLCVRFMVGGNEKRRI